MNNKDLKLLHKGYFEPIDENFIKEGTEILKQLKVIQEKYQKEDTDTFINELRDSIAGKALGFNLVNTEKHGFDCKEEKNQSIYLEVKSASFIAKTWQATFNDTTFEKAEAFKNKNVYLALAVWNDASDLLFICYGQNREIGEFLEKKVKHFKEGRTVRSTQSIPLSTLVFNYGFKILAVNRSKQEVLNILKAKNLKFKNLTIDNIVSVEEFNRIEEEIYC